MSVLYAPTVNTQTVPGTVEIHVNRMTKDGKEYLEFYVKTPTSGRPYQLALDEILTKEQEALRLGRIKEANVFMKEYVDRNSGVDSASLVWCDGPLSILVGQMCDDEFVELRAFPYDAVVVTVTSA